MVSKCGHADFNVSWPPLDQISGSTYKQLHARNDDDEDDECML